MDTLPAEEEVSGFEAALKYYRVPIVLGSISVVAIVVALVLLIKSTQTITPIQFSHAGAGNTLGSQSASLLSGTVAVDVEGAVVRPGVIFLTAGARVGDAVASAGGLLRDADESYVSKNVNRAMKVTDGMKIYIPKIGDVATSHNLDCTTSTGDVAQSCGVVTTSAGSSQNATLVSVNSASKDELDSLPGVGPITAQKIIDNRPYQTLDDLVAKKAIGPSLFSKLKNILSL